MSPLRGAGVVAVVALACALPGAALAEADTAGVPVAEFPSENLCTPDDPALDELSGLAAVGGRLFATPDAGVDESVVELDLDCTVMQRFPVPVDPYDIEDLAAGPDGRLWLADIGDNTSARQTVALISLDPDSGAGDLYRLTYPDGPRDAEAVLVSASGEPVIVTKTLFGASGVYRPARGRALEQLATPGPTPLEKVGSLALGPTDTPGGPLPGASSTLITGGAVSPDGTVAAVRTYTDVYLFHAPDTDLVAALTAGPALRIPVPDEPQGEAVAFTSSGDLVTGSEAVVQGGTLTEARPPIRVWRGVTDHFGAKPVSDTESNSDSYAGPIGVAAGVAVLVAVGAVILRFLRTRRS
ncbi:hypothetical protein HCA61_14065 [Rhodococcus sp. HNM0563]|uniref:hypothetical protein n=1 Tax=unclassified Rhodococcus (in: high G+C Gram-positive bacteria) TaxID=192944 RepID=UPI00146BE593|nr:MULTISPECIES: hypothetical protein [unclassified Rhodococcus (in: high G+C Gram-positive bacteria)]MCK0092172.1 hypothetical protein [Rhodococcus sp. F64268]NLU63388.1 hypothetical protein [Rhodococcus sp. HNM0563]